MSTPQRWVPASIAICATVVASGCMKEGPDQSRLSTAAPAPSLSTPGTHGTGTIADLGGAEWKLLSFADAESVPSDIDITLAVGGEQISGQGGCNRYMGSIRNGDAPGKVTVGPLATTRMACPPPQEAAEARYTKALAHALSFAVADGRLMIVYRDGDSERILTYARR